MQFEELQVWQNARDLAREIYSVSKSGEFSKDFALRDQIRRSSVSVMSNIAEGFERISLAEKRQFYNISRGSCCETRSLCYVLFDAGYITEQQLNEFKNHTIRIGIRIGKQITGLISSTDRRS